MSVKVITSMELQFMLETLDQIMEIEVNTGVLPFTLLEDVETCYNMLDAIKAAPDRPIPDTIEGYDE